MKRWEERVEASEEYANQHVHPIEWNKSYCDFKSGAEWADETITDKICKWLKEHLYDDIYLIRDNEGTWVDVDLVIEDLKKLTEE